MDKLTNWVALFAPGARIERGESLKGGVSASVQAVTLIHSDGRRERVVLREPRKHDWKESKENPALQEFKLLERLFQLGVAVPKPRLLVPGAFFLDFVDGTTIFPANGPEPMAALLAKIHATPVEGLPDLPPRLDPVPELFTWLTPSPELAKAVSERGTFESPSRLLHGDFWPGNLIWKDDRIAAVVDWEDSALGDPLSDLACARAELTCAAGEEAAFRFTSAYLKQSGLSDRRLPIWDLYVSTAALASMDSWGLSPEVLTSRRNATQAFQDRALKAVVKPTR